MVKFYLGNENMENGKIKIWVDEERGMGAEEMMPIQARVVHRRGSVQGEAGRQA